MRKQLTILGTALLTGLAACAGTGTTEDPSPLDSIRTPAGDAHMEVVAEGGIAALSIADVIDRDSRAYVHVTRRLCAKSCQPPMDSASGVAAAASVDSLFTAAIAQRDDFKDDYGITGQAADMMVYTVRVTALVTTPAVLAAQTTAG